MIFNGAIYRKSTVERPTNQVYVHLRDCRAAELRLFTYLANKVISTQFVFFF